MEGIEYLIAAIASILTFIFGVIFGKRVLSAKNRKLEKDLHEEHKDLSKKKRDLTKELEKQANILKKNKILEAKEKIYEIKNSQEKEYQNRLKNIHQQQSKIKDRENNFNKKLEDLQRKTKEIISLKKKLTRHKEVINNKSEEIQQIHIKKVAELEKVANLSAKDAKKQLIESLIEDAKNQSNIQIKEIIDEAKLTANKEARKLVLTSLQRVATEEAIENSTSVLHIEDDEMKGRIIGREGRNIRAFEAVTGVEIIVDDTPESIVISSFDPIRREVARLALHKLITDGRIHPARIEEIVKKTRKKIEEEIIEIGEKTCMELGIVKIHPELVKLIGKMRYRHSYGQNLLQHSREVANICAIMAAELGINVKRAKRAGLLHDIGKVSDENPNIPHAILGGKLAEKYKEHPSIINAIAAHHDEIEMTSVISPLVQVCDSISGARPGARRETYEAYISKLKDLEDIALSYEGVQKSYAMQAGRELRVIVESNKVKDENADKISFDISQQIQEKIKYPGQIKVTVIREKRSVAYAK